MTPTHAYVLFLAATLAGALNSVAGGGSFISFPALLIYGNIPPPMAAIRANATNTVALSEISAWFMFCLYHQGALKKKK